MSKKFPTSEQHLRNSFSKLFWGLLLVVLDFSINQFDLFPDVIGYLLVGFGCAGLVTLSPRFSTAKVLAFILTGFWLLQFFVPNDLRLVFRLTNTAFYCVLIWQILGGVSDFAIVRERLDIASSAQWRRVAYVTIVVGMTFLGHMQGLRNAGPLVLLILGAMFILLGLILHLIQRAKVELLV